MNDINMEKYLERLDSYIDKHNTLHMDIMESRAEENQKIWVEISVLKVKATVWGAMGGLITTLGAILTGLLLNFVKGG